MSKYIETRKQKIKELSEQLNIVNQRIDLYALRLKNILSNYSNVYQLIHNNFNDIKEDSSLSYKRIAISFYYNYKHNSFCFEKKEFYLNANNFSFGILSTLNYFIELMDQEFSLTAISKDIIESESTYSQIRTLYLEIFKKHSDFTIFTDSFSQLVLNFNNKNPILDNSQDNIISVGFKKNNKLEELAFLPPNKDKKLCLNFYTPLIDDFFNVYKKNKEQGFLKCTEILNTFFKDELLLLNKNLLIFFDIESEKIISNLYFSQNFDSINTIEEFVSNIKFEFHILWMEKDKLKILHEKLTYMKKLENF